MMTNKRNYNVDPINIDWEAPPTAWKLPDDGADEVQVWCVEPQLNTDQLDSLQNTLSPDELDRANKFHFAKDRQNFIIARGWLRTILSRYLPLAPAELVFSYGAQGKPELSCPGAVSLDLRFNLSHTEGLILYAVSRRRVLGIDVERIRPDFATESIAEHFFSPQEVSALRSLPLSDQPRGFFNCWTRKEAYLKARSEGLSFPLTDFDMSLRPGEPPALLRVKGDGAECQRWSLVHLIPQEGYVAALAIEGQPATIRYYRAIADYRASA